MWPDLASTAQKCPLLLPHGLSLVPPHPSSWPPPFPKLLSMKDNYLFLKEVKSLVEKTNCELKVCFQYINRGDRWIQVRNPGLGRTWSGAQARRAPFPRDPGTPQLPVGEVCCPLARARVRRDRNVQGNSQQRCFL